jgi:hypothetical protein
MFMLTREKGSIESGAYATRDNDGTTVVQFFVNSDDALCYNEQLKACDFNLEVTEIPDEAIDKLCDVLGFAYTVAEPGDLVMPRLEILETLMTDL